MPLTCLIDHADTRPGRQGSRYARFVLCLDCYQAGYRFVVVGSHVLVRIPFGGQRPDGYIPVGVVTRMNRQLAAQGKLGPRSLPAETKQSQEVLNG